jgi:hypothetical protein
MFEFPGGRNKRIAASTSIQITAITAMYLSESLLVHFMNTTEPNRIEVSFQQ